MEGMPSNVEGGLGLQVPRERGFLEQASRPKTDEDHVQVFHPPEQRLAVGRGVIFDTTPMAKPEEILPSDHTYCAKSSWGQTMMVWADPSLAAAALVGVVIGLGLPSQLWSWFGRGILEGEGESCLWDFFSRSSQMKPTSLILPF